MIMLRIDCHATGNVTASDCHAVIIIGNSATGRYYALRDNSDPVRFLDPEFFDTEHACDT